MMIAGGSAVAVTVRAVLRTALPTTADGTNTVSATTAYHAD